VRDEIEFAIVAERIGLHARQEAQNGNSGLTLRERV
jgi:hypothetical protein